MRRRALLATVGAVAAAVVVPASPARASLSAAAVAAQPVATMTLTDPTSVTADETACQANSGVEVTVAWLVDSAGADGIEVQRSPDGGTTFAVVATVPPDADGWVDTTAAFASTYVYAVATTRGAWRSPGALTAQVTTSAKSCRTGGPGGGPSGGGGRP